MASYRTPSRGRPLTIAEFQRLPDDGDRLELVRGHVVREPPAGAEHGGVGSDLARLLGNFVREHGLGRILIEAGFLLAEDPPTVRAPDIAFIAADRLPADGLPAGYFQGAPDLAVEVVSPSNTVAEIRAKVEDCLAAGARAVWVVDPRTRSVAVHGPDGDASVLRRGDELDGGGVLPGFRVPVAEVFGA